MCRASEPIMIPTMTRMRKLRLLAVAVLVALLVPIPYLASPQWTIVVSDEAGHPLRGMLLRLSYENYSVEDSDHEIDLSTDSIGQVIFPAQRRSATLLTRFYYTARSAMALAHASFGPIAYVTFFGEGREGSVDAPDGTVYFWNGKPARVFSTVVARPRDQ